jgi:alpha-1,6-mannosyltransferase
VVFSAVGTLLFATFAAAPGSPFQPVLPAGAEPAGPFRWLAVTVGFDRLYGRTLVGTGVLISAICLAGFVLLLIETWRGTITVRTAVILVIAYHAVVLLLPLLFSRDVYSYAFYGRIAGVYHANPYVRTPVDFAQDPLWPLVGPKWVDTPAVYGPLWTSISALIAKTTHAAAATINAYRWIAVAASLATVALIWDTTRRVWPSRTAYAVAVFGANPVVLFHSVGSGHNDVLIALGVIGAFACLVRGKTVPAVAILALAALVKATAVVPLLLVLVWCVARVPRNKRAHTALTHVGLAAVIGVVFALPYMNTHDPTFGMLELAGHEGWLAPSAFLRELVDDVSFGTLGWLVRIGFALALVATIALLARDVARRATERTPRDLGAAMGWSLIAVMLLGPLLLPWYVTWALPLAWLLPRAPRVALIAAGLCLAFAQWTTEPLRYPGAFSVNLWFGHWIVVPIMVVLLVIALFDLWHRLRTGLPLEDQESVAEASGQH